MNTPGSVQSVTEYRQKERDLMVSDLSAAATMVDLSRLFSDWRGFADHGCDALDELRGILQDHVREYCYAMGIQCPAFP